MPVKNVKPKFLLGVGAQKAGTSWVHQQLALHPEVWLPPSKELHVFDAFFQPELHGAFFERRLQKLNTMLGKVAAQRVSSPDILTPMSEAFSIFNMALDLDRYVDFFLAAAVRNPVSVVGEITPSYSTLESRHLVKVRNRLVPFFKPRVLFLMRDPVERVWASIRMEHGRAAQSPDQHSSAAALFEDQYMAGKFERQTRYDLTIQNLQNAFEEEEVFFGFFEEVFQDETWTSLGNWLGIENRPPKSDEKINQGTKAKMPDRKILEEARNHLDPVYQFCANEFGEERIRKLWKWYDLRD